MEPAQITLLIRLINLVRENRRRKKMLKNLKWGAVAALVIGSVSQSLGIDLAPGQIDALVNAAAVIVYVVGEIVERRKAQ